MSRLPLLIVPVALLCLAAPAEARTSLLPEGKYDCAAFMPEFIAAGKLEIRGESYRGPSLNGKFPDGWIDFESDEDGNVFLINKPFGGFGSDPYQVTHGEAFINTEGGNTLRVHILSNSTGNRFYVDCTHRP